MMTQEKTANPAMSGGLALLALLGALALPASALFLGGIASDEHRSQSLPVCCWL